MAAAQPLDVLTVAVRPATDTDYAFIFDSWLNSYRETLQPGPARAWGSARDRYYRELRRRLRMLLARDVQLLVACDPDDRDHILGFICAEPPLLHYVYVKHPFRGQGVALQLLAAAGLGGASTLLVTHWSSVCDRLSIARPKLLRYVGLDVPHVLAEVLGEDHHRSSH